MADFVNTLDTMAPEEAEDAMISGLSEFVETRIDYVPQELFDNDKTIRKAIFPAATGTSSYSFRKSDIEEIRVMGGHIGYFAAGDCKKLRKLDMAGQDSLGDAGSNWISLIALVLRSVVLVAMNKNLLTGSPIAAGTGYVYVPRNLIDQYKAATNWSAYAGQFRALQDYTVDGTIDGELDESKI